MKPEYVEHRNLVIHECERVSTGLFYTVIVKDAFRVFVSEFKPTKQEALTEAILWIQTNLCKPK